MSTDLPSFDEPIGLFPLPNVVLFPGATLPLQVFEPRYRSLVRDALDDDGLIAMAWLRPGYEAYYYTNLAEIDPVVCVGRIREHVQVADGRYFVNLLGVCRARVRDEEREGPYRRATLEALMASESGIEIDGEFAARRALDRGLARPVFRHVASAGRCRAAIQSGASLGTITDMIAYQVLPTDAVELKQALLAETNPLRRARTLLTELGIITNMLEFNERARQNWPRLGSEN